MTSAATASKSKGHTVLAVVVTYRPDTKTLTELLRALVAQVNQVLIVDNTPALDDRVHAAIAEFTELPSTLRLVRLGKNLGIAAALNVGIRAAIAEGFDYVLLSDQDSVPAPDMVRGLLRASAELTKQGIRIGAVGPIYTDLHTGITFSFQAEVPGKFFYGHVPASSEVPLVEALSLITSGTLIPAPVFATVGTMREDFFIDNVDIEWCHRARSMGLRLFGTSYATMFHRMGDAHLRVWYCGWRNESAYAPIRIYYFVRNFIVLCKAPYIRGRWKIRNAWYCLGLVYSHVIFGHERRDSLKMAVRGLWDGLRGRGGPLTGSDSC